jgi:hypothetical protein
MATYTRGTGNHKATSSELSANKWQEKVNQARYQIECAQRNIAEAGDNQVCIKVNRETIKKAEKRLAQLMKDNPYA